MCGRLQNVLANRNSPDIFFTHFNVASDRAHLVRVGDMAGREVGRTPTLDGVTHLHATRDDQGTNGQHEDRVSTVETVAEAVAAARACVLAVRQEEEQPVHGELSSARLTVGSDSLCESARVAVGHDGIPRHSAAAV